MYYEIENSALKIGVETAGAQLKTIYSKKTDTEYLWQGDERSSADLTAENTISAEKRTKSARTAWLGTTNLFWKTVRRRN